LQIWTDQNPQGFSYREYGECKRGFIDIEGMSLIKVAHQIKAECEITEQPENFDPETD